MQKILTLSSQNFEQVCQNIVRGFGFSQAEKFPYSGVEVAFREKLSRESSDGMFRTEETWLIAFARPNNKELKANDFWEFLSAILQAAQEAKVENLLTVFFDKITLEDIKNYHATANRAGIKSAVLTDKFAADLAGDYASEIVGIIKRLSFSFARLRERMQQQAREATWREQFQSLSALPTRVKSGQTDSILDEADLFRAAFKSHSFLLLGEPGAGKSTSLQALAEAIAQKGGHTPILMPLNQYQGDLLVDLGRNLCEGLSPLSKEDTLTLLSSGVLTVMLDGINEVQILQSQLVEEINKYTHPQHQAACSQWIVSGRKYDYSQDQGSLETLEKHTWELQPLTPDLIYQFLTDGLGEDKGQETYNHLGATIREICGNPLLLNMVVTVCRETGNIPAGRGSLYHQFVDLLLRWGEERVTSQEVLDKLSQALGISLTPDTYREIAREAMATLAQDMITTAIAYKDARESIWKSLSQSANPNDSGPKLLLEDLIERGILKRRGSSISFMHHTFEEYFQAYGMRDVPVSTLIPEEGVQGHKREAVVFLAGLISNPNPLIERAVSKDSQLAYDLIRETTAPVNKPLLHKVGEKLWNDTRWGGGGWIGSQCTVALKFKALATRLGQTVEDFAREIRQPSNEMTFAEELHTFYREIGDTSSQQELFKKLGINELEDIPNDWIWKQATTAYAARNNQKALELYTKYLEQYPNYGSAYGNRALVYNALNRNEEALADYRRAIELNPNSGVIRTNLASLLLELKQREEAIEQLETAIQVQPKYPNAHYELGSLLADTDPEVALPHLQEAVRLAFQVAPQDLNRYLQELADVQEKTGNFRGSMGSLRQLIERSPTSYSVKKWKQKIATLRLQLDEQEKQRSVRERLLDGGEIQLWDLAQDFFKSAGYNCRYVTSSWLIGTTEKLGIPPKLPIFVLDVPNLTATQIRTVVESLPAQVQSVQTIAIFSPAEVLEPEARMQLLVYQAERTVTLITSLEAQGALLKGNQDCARLISDSLKQATAGGDPFKNTEIVKASLDFFGRSEEVRELTSLIKNRQLVGLYGIHKIGKSSLLRRVEQTLNVYWRDITPIWVEMSDRLKNTSDLYRQILQKLPHDQEIPIDSIISVDYFVRILKQFQQQQQQKYPGHRILLILDEYAYLIPDRSGKGGIQDYLEVLGTFKTLYQEEGWFIFLPCGRTTALSRVGSWQQGENPFIGILQSKLLKPFTRRETDDMVKALAKIFAITGGHPLFTRILGSHIRTIAQEQKVTDDLVEKAAKAYLTERDDKALLVAIYEERLDEEEQHIAELLAVSDQPLVSDQIIPNDASQATRRRIQDAIDNLLDTSVLQEDAQGRLSHRYELLRRVIDQKIGTAKREKLTAQLPQIKTTKIIETQPPKSSSSEPNDKENSTLNSQHEKKKDRNKRNRNKIVFFIFLVILGVVLALVITWFLSSIFFR